MVSSSRRVWTKTVATIHYNLNHPKMRGKMHICFVIAPHISAFPVIHPPSLVSTHTYTHNLHADIHTYHVHTYIHTYIYMGTWRSWCFTSYIWLKAIFEKSLIIWNPVYRICDDYKYDRYKKCSNSIYVISLINFSATQNSWMNRIDYIDTYVAHANIKNTN